MRKYEATYGGAEANVAVSLANYGMDVAFVSKLPSYEIGQSAVNSLRKFGVDTSQIVQKTKNVDPNGELVTLAKAMGVCFGD